MTQSIKDQMENLVKEIAKDNTLSAEAAQKYAETMKRVVILEQTVDDLRKKNFQLSEELQNSAERCVKFLEEVDAFKKREVDLKKREDKCLEHELKAEYNALRVQDHKEMMTTVFRNSVIMKNIFESQNGYHDNNGMWQGDRSSSRSVEVKTE